MSSKNSRKRHQSSIRQEQADASNFLDLLEYSLESLSSQGLDTFPFNLNEHLGFAEEDEKQDKKSTKSKRRANDESTAEERESMRDALVDICKLLSSTKNRSILLVAKNKRNRCLFSVLTLLVHSIRRSISQLNDTQHQGNSKKTKQQPNTLKSRWVENVVLASLSLAKVCLAEDGLEMLTPQLLSNVVPSEDGIATLSNALVSLVQWEEKLNQQGTCKRITDSNKGVMEDVEESELLLEGLEEILASSEERRREMRASDTALVALFSIASVHVVSLKSFASSKNQLADGEVEDEKDRDGDVKNAGGWSDRDCLKCTIGNLLEASRMAIKEWKGEGARKTDHVAQWRVKTYVELLERYSSVTRLSKLFFSQNDSQTRKATGEEFLRGLVDIAAESMEEILEAFLGSNTSKDLEWLESLSLAALRVLANLTHENEVACELMRSSGALERACSILDKVVSSMQKSNTLSGNSEMLGLFDLNLTLLGLLSNSVEEDVTNRQIVGRHSNQVVDLIMSHLPQDTRYKLEQGVLGKKIEFGWTGEALVTCGYACMLLGCLMRDNAANTSAITSALPCKSLSILIQTLDAFTNFQRQGNVLSEDLFAKIVQVMEEMARLNQGTHLPIATAPARRIGKHRKKEMNKSDTKLPVSSSSSSSSLSSKKQLPPVPAFHSDLVNKRRIASSSTAAGGLQNTEGRTEQKVKHTKQEHAPVMPKRKRREPNPTRKKQRTTKSDGPVADLDDVF